MGIIAPWGATRQPSDRSLDRLYSLPNECLSLEDWFRARNLDLADADDAGLDREDFRLRNRRSYETESARAEWLDERRAAIRLERHRRRLERRRIDGAEPVAVVWGRGRLASAITGSDRP